MPGEPGEPGDTLTIRSLEFLGGMAAPGGWRPDSALPEIAVAGRSNVGKSSLLNRLMQRKKFARVSNTPGRTREINFFKVNGEFLLADLPGYGYARVSHETRAQWRPLIEGYLRTTPELRGVVQLLDARHDPTADDRRMLDFLEELGLPAVIVLTKVDKLARNARARRITDMGMLVGVEEDQIIPFSAVTGEGRDEIGAAVQDLLGRPSWRVAS